MLKELEKILEENKVDSINSLQNKILAGVFEKIIIRQKLTKVEKDFISKCIDENQITEKEGSKKL